MVAWLRTPLLRFVVLGGILFALDRVRGAGSAGVAVPPAPVVITAARIRQLRDDYARATRLLPTAADDQALVAHAIDDELLYRDALARGLDRDDRSIRWQLVEKMSFLDGQDEYGADREALYQRARGLGLERDDPVIRRMLVEKVRLLVQEAVAREPVTELELRDYLARHADAYRQPARIGLWHVFLSRARRGTALEADAQHLLAELRTGNTSPEDAVLRGDGFPLASHLQAQSPRALTAVFGERFAGDVMRVSPGAWAGPFASAYGLHLVRVDAVEPGAVAPLDAVRDRVLVGLRRERTKARLAGLVAGLRRARAVRVEWPAGGGS